MRKKYNTPHRRHVVKTRMTDEEYADFTGRLAAYEISQSEFIRQAIRKATIRPIVTVSPVNDGLLAALSSLLSIFISKNIFLDTNIYFSLIKVNLQYI